ncbi:MAG: hypothetical protein FJX74_00130 [Armatimonadetes bacterium]|nr:hypothetical protein [Armatimonadota bacterium]
MPKTAERLPADLFLAEPEEVLEPPRESAAEAKPRPRVRKPPPVEPERKEQVTIYLSVEDHVRLEEARVELLRRAKRRVTKSDLAAAAIRLATADMDRLVAAL